MAPRAGHLLQAGPHDLLLARVAEGCGKAAEVEEAHAADVGDHARGEKRLIEVLQARELLGVGVADGLRGGLVAADEGGRVERGHGKAHEVRGKRRSGGVHGDERLPVLGRVARALSDALSAEPSGPEKGLAPAASSGVSSPFASSTGEKALPPTRTPHSTSEATSDLVFSTYAWRLCSRSDAMGPPFCLGMGLGPDGLLACRGAAAAVDVCPPV